jgi:uncharacterized protein (TIGR00730 family)
VGFANTGFQTGATITTMKPSPEIAMSTSQSANFSMCVYCGSRPGADPRFAQSARDTGALIGSQGWELVYGGGKVGLMGMVADATLAAGGTVYGVIPQTLIDKEVGHTGLTELHVVDNMHTRKTMMFERADAFVALPGGIGTFEELFEIWTWYQLGMHRKPFGLLNVAGYYDPLITMLDSMVAQGFLNSAVRELLHVGTDVGELLQRLRALAGRDK